MLVMLTKSASVFALVFILSSSVSAVDLQIQDHNNLIRLLADVRAPQQIEVQLSDEPKSLSLEHLDGLQQKRQAASLGGKRFVFESVDPGNWRLRVRPRSIVVQKVLVKNE